MSDLEQLAIQRIKAASEMSLSHYKQPLICTYSGGKDSDVMLRLFRRSGIPFEVLNSHTTADAPPQPCGISARYSTSWSLTESAARSYIRHTMGSGQACGV